MNDTIAAGRALSKQLTPGMGPALESRYGHLFLYGGRHHTINGLNATLKVFYEVRDAG